jgi:hypothetical protein
MAAGSVTRPEASPSRLRDRDLVDRLGVPLSRDIGRRIVRTTAEAAKALGGDKLYQRRARAALPLLVRQASAHSPIFYSSLAKEVGIPNPRNLNFVLGSIGQALELLGASWGDKIPAIQCLVINKNTLLPGEGIGGFIEKKEDFWKLPRWQQRALIGAELNRVFAYPRWKEVLDALKLKPAPLDFSAIADEAAKFRGGGESPMHKRLKEFVASHPEAIGLSPKLPSGQMEFPLPSGDVLDVLFKRGIDLVGVEVKSLVSGIDDIARGVFQCVKYRAVLEAYQASRNHAQSARAVLALEGPFPAILLPLKNLLGIEVVDGVAPAP